jgi:nucleoside-diphosphate-sugar epimerase
MIRDEKILVTGATGAIARPVARFLAGENEVWGAARFTNENHRRELEDAGVQTARIDLETGDISALPDDFSYVLHYAYTRRPSGQFSEAIEVNAVRAGRILQKCQSAKAALIVSAATLYTPHEDPNYAYTESDDIGAVIAPWGASSPVSKVSLEAVARFCAEAFELPTVILRPSVPYGCEIDMATTVLDAVLADQPVFAVHDPQPLSVIHVDDMCAQIEALLGAASIPATILNWSSDEIVTVQEMAEQVAARVGKTATFQVAAPPGVARGAVLDTSRLRPIAGPCRRPFRESFAEIIEARLARSYSGAPQAHEEPR